jgi:hypothetical protein
MFAAEAAPAIKAVVREERRVERVRLVVRMLFAPSPGGRGFG